MPNIPILIVDDNLLNIKLINHVLTSNGYEVLVAINAKEALQILSTQQPRLILMDLQLPGTNGLELTRQLKANPRYQKTPIIAITAYVTKGDDEQAFAAGCDGYITKPIDIKRLPDIIAGYLYIDR